MVPIEQKDGTRAGIYWWVSVKGLTPTPPSEPLKPSRGAAVRDHRNAVRDRSESLSAIDRNHCPHSPESAGKTLVAVDLTEIEHTPSTRTPTRLDSKATISQLEICRLEALASSHRNDFEHQRDRNDRIVAELLKLTADLMASKENAARLNGELSAIRARPWWRRMAG
jgi:hypothetical protein